MSLTLTSRQHDDLLKAMLDYLLSCDLTRTAEQLREEVPALADYDPSNDSRISGLMAKKWTSVIRLQKKILDLETRLSRALEAAAKAPSSSSKRTSATWLPNTNSLKHTLTGHRMPITAVAFHPMYSVLVSASEDTTLKVWDWESGEHERTLKGHTRLVSDCDFDSKGKNLVSCSQDMFIKLWNVENEYTNFATLRGHDHSVSSARFSPDDLRIISASRDQTVRVWEIATTHCIKVIKAHDAWIRRALPSADGKLILTCSDDHTARLAELESGALKTEMRGHENVVEAAIYVPAACLPAIRELLSPGSTEQEASKLPTERAPASHASYIATASRDKTIKLWDAQHGHCVHTFAGHNNWVRSLVFHPAGTHLLSGADDNTFRIWDLRTGRCAQTVETHTKFVQAVTWGRQVVSTSGDGGSAEDVGKVINVVATASWDKTVKVWYP